VGALRRWATRSVRRPETRFGEVSGGRTSAVGDEKRKEAQVTGDKI